jgi:hypothetical protein
MRSRLAVALLYLLLGATLADYISTRGANAQAMPPSSGGTSYTHPSAISLSNGIDSADGGTFTGPVVIKDYAGNNGRTLFTDPTSGRLVLDYITVANGLISTAATAPIQAQSNAGQLAFSAYYNGAYWCLGSACTDYFTGDGTDMGLIGMGLSVPSGSSLNLTGAQVATDSARLWGAGAHDVQCRNAASSTYCTFAVGTLAAQSTVVSGGAGGFNARGTLGVYNDSGDVLVGDVHKLGVAGTAQKDEVSGTGTLDFPDNMAVWACDDLTLTATGAATANNPTCEVGAVPDVADRIYYCWVSAANTVTVRSCGTGDPASASIRAKVTDY